jgi:hypothetical protein
VCTRVEQLLDLLIGHGDLFTTTQAVVREFIELDVSPDRAFPKPSDLGNFVNALVLHKSLFYLLYEALYVLVGGVNRQTTKLGCCGFMSKEEIQ